MAKLLVEIDTDTDAVSVSVDGKDFPNVRSVNIWVSPVDDDGDGDAGPDPHFEVYSSESVGDLSRYVRLCASEHAKPGPLDTVTQSAVAGYVEVREASAITSAVAACLSFGRKR